MHTFFSPPPSLSSAQLSQSRGHIMITMRANTRSPPSPPHPSQFETEKKLIFPQHWHSTTPFKKVGKHSTDHVHPHQCHHSFTLTNVITNMPRKSVRGESRTHLPWPREPTGPSATQRRARSPSSSSLRDIHQGILFSRATTSCGSDRSQRGDRPSGFDTESRSFGHACMCGVELDGFMFRGRGERERERERERESWSWEDPATREMQKAHGRASFGMWRSACRLMVRE